MPRSRRTPPLAEWYVISLRPLGGHGPVRRAAGRHGARCFACSTLALEPLPAGETLRAALACPRVVCTSPAAVRFAHRQQPLRMRRGQTWLAVGAGTARALARVGVAGALVPPVRQDSEGLLALPALQSVRASEIGLLTAPGGRGAIAASLQAAGARVAIAEVYRRRPLAPTAARRRALLALPPQSALLVSSVEALQPLWSALEADERRRLAARPAIASSPRLARHLQALGFRQVAIAASAHPGDLLEALAAHVASGRFR